MATTGARVRRGAVGLALGTLLAACGAEDGTGRVAFSQVEVQAYLESEAARTLPGLAVGAATCPVPLPERPGTSATCTVLVERVPLDYEVERLTGERFEARPSRPIVIIEDVVTAVRSKLGDQAAQVRCGDAAVAQPAPGAPLLCQLEAAGSTRPAVVRVAGDGTITVSDP